MKNLFYFFCLSLIVSVMVACSDDKDKLENKWQLRSYELPDGSVRKSDSIFYNFQKGSFSAICVLRDNGYHTFFGNYSLSDDKISIILRPGEDLALCKEYMGWSSLERVYQVDELSSSALRLSYKDTLFVFRKY